MTEQKEFKEDLNNNGMANEEQPEENMPAESPAVSEMSEVEKLSAQLVEEKDKYLRLYSDFENFRKQKIKERVELLQSAGADIIRELLPLLDDFDRAVASNENIDDPETLKEGFKLIHHKLKNTLERKGLKEMKVIGEEFNTDEHEAITNIPAPSEGLKGKVVEVAEKGYLLNEKVIRFAKVIVGK